MIRTLLLATALLACKHKPTEPTAGSAGSASSPSEGSAVTGSAGSATTGSAVTGSAAPGSGGSAAAGPATPDSAGSATAAGSAAPVKQPKRSAKDAAVFSDAEHAFDEATTAARAAKTTKDACAVIDPLENKLGGLDKVTPPKGFEHEFAEARDGLGMKVDFVQSNTCADAAAKPDEVAHGLDRAREALNVLEGVGAK